VSESGLIDSKIIQLQNQSFAQSEGDIALEEAFIQRQLSVTDQFRKQAKPYEKYFSIEDELIQLSQVKPEFYEETVEKYREILTNRIQVIDAYNKKLADDFRANPYIISQRLPNVVGAVLDIGEQAKHEYLANFYNERFWIYDPFGSGITYNGGAIGYDEVGSPIFPSQPSVDFSNPDIINAINLRAIDISFRQAADVLVRFGVKPDFSWAGKYPLYRNEIEARSKSFNYDVLRAVHDATPDSMGLGGIIVFHAFTFFAALGTAWIVGPIIIPVGLASAGYAISESDNPEETAAIIGAKAIVAAGITYAASPDPTPSVNIRGEGSEGLSIQRFGFEGLSFDPVYAGFQPSVDTSSPLFGELGITGDYANPSIESVPIVYPSAAFHAFESGVQSIANEGYNKLISFVKNSIFGFLKPESSVSESFISGLKKRGVTGASSTQAETVASEVITEVNHTGNIVLFLVGLFVLFVIMLKIRKG
jgi:hypothetical protein